MPAPNSAPLGGTGAAYPGWMRGPQLRPLGSPVGDALAQISHVSVDEWGKLFPWEGVVAVPCDFGDDEESGE